MAPSHVGCLYSIGNENTWLLAGVSGFLAQLRCITFIFNSNLHILVFIGIFVVLAVVDFPLLK